MTVKKKENRAKEREEGMRAERTQCVCVFVNVSMRLSVCVRERKREGGMVKQSRCASDQLFIVVSRLSQWLITAKRE